MSQKWKKTATQTPLGREYARLNSPSTDDPALDVFCGARTIQAHDLKVWTATIRPTEHPVGPDAIRTNPVVVGALVLCSTFSPGKIVAFDRETGTRRWSLPLAYFGHHLYHPPGSRLVYGGTSQELLAIRPETGTIAWSFSPYGRKGETMYSSPTVADGRLFIGDRRGYLHCLDAGTGEPVWSVRTSRATNNDVNSTPVVHAGVVAVGTNAKLALGYEAASGRRVWRRRLHAPCCWSVVAGGNAALLRTRRSAYLMKVADGNLLHCWRRRHQKVDHGCVAGDVTLLVTRRVWRSECSAWPVSQLRAYRGDEEIYTLPYPRWASASVRYEAATGMVYEATTQGLGILDPATGVRKVVTGFGDDPVMSNSLSQPFVQRGRLYVLNGRGQVFALRHP